MKKHPVLKAILIILAVVVVSNIINTPTSTPITSRPSSSTRLTAQQVADKIEHSLSVTMPGHYTTELDTENKIFRVNTWQEDIDGAAISLTKNTGHTANWNSMVESMKSLVSDMQSRFNDYGHDDYIVVYSLCDPANHDTPYVTIANGIAGYDVVNDIDLLNNNG